MSARPPILTLTGVQLVGEGPWQQLLWCFELDHAWLDDEITMHVRTSLAGDPHDVQWISGFRDGTGWPVDDPALPDVVERRIDEEIARVQLANALATARDRRWAA